MADSDDAKRTWSAWVNRWLAVRGKTQAMLVAASGGALNTKTVSKWVNGTTAASVELAIVTARILNAPVVEAVAAAGFPLAAEEMSKDAPEAPVDPGVYDILTADFLTDGEKAGYIKMYQADLAQAVARSREMIQIARNARRRTAS